MIGIMLVYVGAVLLVNGMGGLGRIDAKSAAVLNFMVGSLGVVVSLLHLVRAESPVEYFTVATLFLFTFTYLYVAISSWYDLDMRGFGWYCFFCCFDRHTDIYSHISKGRLAVRSILAYLGSPLVRILSLQCSRKRFWQELALRHHFRGRDHLLDPRYLNSDRILVNSFTRDVASLLE